MPKGGGGLEGPECSSWSGVGRGECTRDCDASGLLFERPGLLEGAHVPCQATQATLSGRAAVCILFDGQCQWEGQEGVDYKSGAWNLEWREKYSNCHKAENLTDRLECLVADGLLCNHKVFLITNKSAFEGAYYKGHSLLRELLDIAFQVHKAQHNGGFILHVIHIFGRRMKVSGVGGLSQGDLTKGMMAGQTHSCSSHSTQRPMNAQAAEYWCGSGVGGKPGRVHTLGDFFEGHHQGYHVQAAGP
jgi:hypothetical protein